jgi:hypothetical protein
MGLGIELIIRLTGLLAGGSLGGASTPSPAVVEPVAIPAGNKGTPKGGGAQKRRGK